MSLRIRAGSAGWGTSSAARGANAAFAVAGRTDRVLVLASGQAYVIETRTHVLIRELGGQISGIFSVENPDGFVVTNGLWFEREGPEGMIWRTRRISWDGVLDVKVEGKRINGLAVYPWAESPAPFKIDLDSGATTGGSYPPHLPQ